MRRPATTVQPLRRVPGAKARNIVFILADDHRYDAMGFMGHPIVKTPNMDRMAQDGVHFRNAFVTTALCSPSRATILTGLYAHQHRVVDNNSPVPPRHDVLPAVPAAGGLPDGVLRQVAHGQRRRRAAAGVRPLGQLPGAGDVPPDARRPQRRRQEGAAEGLHLRRADRLRARLAQGARQVAAVLPVPVAQGRPPGLRAGRPPQGDPGDAAPAAAQEPDGLRARAGGAAPTLGARPAQQLARRRLSRTTRKLDIAEYFQRYAETLRGRRRQRRARARLPRVRGPARLDARGLHGRQRLRLRRARPDRQAHGVRGVDARADAHAVPGALPAAARRSSRWSANLDVAPTVLAAAGLEPPAYMQGASLLPLAQGQTVPWREGPPLRVLLGAQLSADADRLRAARRPVQVHPLLRRLGHRRAVRPAARIPSR